MGERGREEWGDKQTKGPRQCVTKMAGLYRKEKEREPGPGSLWDLTVYICVKLEFLVEKKIIIERQMLGLVYKARSRTTRTICYTEKLYLGGGEETRSIFTSLWKDLNPE